MSLVTCLPPTGSRPVPGAIVGHGPEKFPIGRPLGSSAGRNWSGVAAERWFHPAGDLPAFVPVCTEVALLVRGPSTVTRRAAGSDQRTTAVPGTVWLCPAGLHEDFISVSADIAEVLHLYLPPQPFAALAKDYGSHRFGVASLRYEAGFLDPLLQAIGAAMLSEMQAETSSGRFLAEALARAVALRLLQNHSDILLHLPSRGTETALDPRRLQRVLEFVEAHLESDISVEDLASTAALSRFHFTRAFKAATGKTPRQHVSERRLQLAKWLLAGDGRSLTEIALSCNFSSQANFARAFHRATGVTPGRYRAVAVAKPQ
jgi:AraC family transcriptional regulator